MVQLFSFLRLMQNLRFPLLCNVINGSKIDSDMMQSLNGMNDSFIFSLLPHILILSNKNITQYKVMTMCQLNLMFTLI